MRDRPFVRIWALFRENWKQWLALWSLIIVVAPVASRSGTAGWLGLFAMIVVLTAATPRMTVNGQPAGTPISGTLFRLLRRRDPDPVEKAKREFARDKISEAEFHRRLELHLDDRNERIRTAVEEVEGIGEELSKPLALRFDSLDELANADREDLEAIHGVGESTASAIEQHLDRAE